MVMNHLPKDCQFLQSILDQLVLFALLGAYENHPKERNECLLPLIYSFQICIPKGFIIFKTTLFPC